MMSRAHANRKIKHINWHSEGYIAIYLDCLVLISIGILFCYISNYYIEHIGVGMIVIFTIIALLTLSIGANHVKHARENQKK